jgi:hypothetical protein
MGLQDDAQSILNSMSVWTGEDPLNCPIAASCSIVALDMILAGANPAKPNVYLEYYTAVRDIIQPPNTES